MPQPIARWQIQSSVEPPQWVVDLVCAHAPGTKGTYGAQLLWQRGLREPGQLAGFLSADRYIPTSPFAFGAEMDRAVDRLQRAKETGETVGIWGDFDADGVTATAVLWEGLGQFFPQETQLFYYIPNRLTESHGLSQQGLDWLHSQGCRLVVTCDTGSTSLTEIAYAQSLGMEVIVTDHHTLPPDRPPVVAILNPRYLPGDHPLATLSGVAVAYKLVEALYQTLLNPPVPPDPLLDLVAIGLIADLVELKGDCRYLAQRGIDRLQRQLQDRTRPGVARLLELCKRSGDRPTDISFGLGPRINAVSRIQGDARFCVELLTSRDPQRCQELAALTELANARRKALQREVYEQVTAKLAQLDLSTTGVIVLADQQWAVGVLGLVAGQVAQEYGRPTILLSIEPEPEEGTLRLARGSARSVNQIDLYQLVQAQVHWLHRFGGHPYAAGLSLPVENIPLFTEAVNQRLQPDGTETVPIVRADLEVTVAELGMGLFQELKLLEPCGMGNPVPRLLIQNCWFENVTNRNIKDSKGQKVRYIQTEFSLRDESGATFPGVWWGHYREDLPPDRCDAIVELDNNLFKRRYEVRLIAVRPTENAIPRVSLATDWLLDWRSGIPQDASGESAIVVRQCPTSWGELQPWFRRALQDQRPLAIAYAQPPQTPPQETWQTLVGIAKYLSRTTKSVSRQRLREKLGVGDRPLQLGFRALTLLGFSPTYSEQSFQVTWQPDTASTTTDTAVVEAIEQFLSAIREEQFRRQYFFHVPLVTLQAVAQQAVIQRVVSEKEAEED